MVYVTEIGVSTSFKSYHFQIGTIVFIRWIHYFLLHLFHVGVVMVLANLVGKRPQLYSDLWVDSDRRRVDNLLAAAYARDKDLKGHGVIVTLDTSAVSGTIYVRTDSCRSNPDDIASTGITMLYDRLVKQLVDEGMDKSVAAFELSRAEARVSYWVHPAAHRYHSAQSCNLDITRANLDDFALASVLNLEQINERDVVRQRAS